MSPEFVSKLIALLQTQVDGQTHDPATDSKRGVALQGSLWASDAYRDDLPTIRTRAEYLGAIEHLEYSIFRRYNNQLTRADRARLDNTVSNTIFKLERYVENSPPTDRFKVQQTINSLKDSVREYRDLDERTRLQARRADQKLAQLTSLTPEGFEEFVGELFEALGYQVEQVGGSGDEGADLFIARGSLRGVVQCKYHKQSVVGSPQLQKFLGTIHHTKCHKGFFVTTSTFSLAAEKFVSQNPIELIDGPRLVELVREVVGPSNRQEPELAWFR